MSDSSVPRPYDLIVRSDRVVTPQGVQACDVAVRDGKITSIAAFGTLNPANSRRVIDVTGKIVMPGGIDPHVHCLWPIPNSDGTTRFTAGPDVVSRAALSGGTTSLIDFARWTAGNTI